MLGLQMNQAGRPDDASQRATNVSLSQSLVAEARALNINVSRACESGLESAVRQGRAERWEAENGDAFEAWNAYVDKYGVPLAKYRKF